MGKNGIYVAAEIFADYSIHGTMNSKQIVLPLIEKLLSKKTIDTNLPSSGKVTLYKKENYYILHLLYADIVLRGEKTQIIEDIPCLTGIYVNLKINEKIKSVISLPDNYSL